MPSAEAWRYVGLELPIRKVGSLCKVSELLTLLELKFLGDRVWLPCSSCQGFAFLLQANIVVLACSNNKGFLKVSTAGELQPHIYSPGNFNMFDTVWVFHHRAGLPDADIGIYGSSGNENHYELLTPLKAIDIIWIPCKSVAEVYGGIEDLSSNHRPKRTLTKNSQLDVYMLDDNHPCLQENVLRY